MAHFLQNEIAHIRHGLRHGARIEMITKAFAARHTREEICEAWWAIKRWPDDEDATEHANDVLEYQAAGVPLINGDEATQVCKTFSAFIPYRPAF